MIKISQLQIDFCKIEHVFGRFKKLFRQGSGFSTKLKPPLKLKSKTFAKIDVFYFFIGKDFCCSTLSNDFS